VFVGAADGADGGCRRVAAAKLGDTNVKHVSGGIKGWKAADETLETADQCRNCGQPKVLPTAAKRNSRLGKPYAWAAWGADASGYWGCIGLSRYGRGKGCNLTLDKWVAESPDVVA
jgi:hypothetical protein